MKEDIHKGIEKYRYGNNYLEFKIEIKSFEYKLLKSKRSTRTEFQTQCSQSHITDQRNQNFLKSI